MIASNRSQTHEQLRVRSLVVPFFATMIAITFLGIIFEYEHLNEGLEHHVFKGAILHTFWNFVGGYVHLSEDTTLTVFMHVPRTSNDAMRTHLYGSPRYKVEGLAIDNSPFWPHNLKDWSTTFLIISAITAWNFMTALHGTLNE